MERFKEEVKLTEAETSRVGRTFVYFASKWNKRARVAKRERKNSEEHIFWDGAARAAFRREGVFLRLASLAYASHEKLLVHKQYHL